jgi:LPXTG-site transpeptidase (sortase) family protein
MSLRTSKVKSYLPKIIWGIIGLVLVACIFRVAIWEHNYYAEKEGSERAVAESAPAETVDETKPTEAEITEYTVAADRPRYLSIEKLGVKNSRIKEMGLTATGELATPSNIFDTGWYFASGKPGEGKTMLLDGHNGGPHVEGIFKHLDTLTKGDIITVERGDGTVFTYEVYDNVAVDLDQAGPYMNTIQQSPVEGQESLSIITCIGEWSQARQTYLSRQFLRAVLKN